MPVAWSRHSSSRIRQERCRRIPENTCLSPRENACFRGRRRSCQQECATRFGLAAGAVFGLIPGIGLPEHALTGIMPPTAADFRLAMTVLVIPQLPLTPGNAVVGARDTARNYSGDKARRMTPRVPAASMGQWHSGRPGARIKGQTTALAVIDCSSRVQPGQAGDAGAVAEAIGSSARRRPGLLPYWVVLSSDGATIP